MGTSQNEFDGYLPAPENGTEAFFSINDIGKILFFTILDRDVFLKKLIGQQIFLLRKVIGYVICIQHFKVCVPSSIMIEKVIKSSKMKKILLFDFARPTSFGSTVPADPIFFINK